MRIYGVVGWKNAGKTGLMERLVTEITSRGITVSTVKHAHHSTLSIFARQLNVCHELHFDGDFPFTLAHLTTSAFHIKGEVCRFVTTGFSDRQFRIQGSNGIVCLNVGHGIRTR